MIRLGDGEFCMLGYDQISPWEHVSRALNTWFGRDDFTPSELIAFTSDMREAVISCDLLGIPRPARQLRETWCGYVDLVFRHYSLSQSNAIYTECNIHRFWQLMLAYDEFLLREPFLGLISCQNIGEEIRKTFLIDEVCLYPVAPERTPTYGSSRSDNFAGLPPHFPGQYNQLLSEISVPYEGAIFLIAAGGAGKVYANMVKDRGGIAIDIGSIADGWAGMFSRKFLGKNADVYSLDCYQNKLTENEKLIRYSKLIRSTFFGTPLDDSDFFYLDAI